MVIGDPTMNTDADNQCDVNNIASPDNIAMIHGLRKFVLAEDTTNGHQNDAAWLVDTLNPSMMTRFIVTPFGSEVTSVYWTEAGDFKYLVLVVQHPYGESDSDRVNDTNSTGPNGYIGYIGPIKKADLEGALTIDFSPVAVPYGDDRHKVKHGFKGGGVGRIIPIGVSICRQLNCVSLLHKYFCNHLR